MNKKILLGLVAIFIVSLVGVGFLRKDHAATGDVVQLYLSPATTNAAPNTTHTVQIRLKMSGSAQVSYIDADLSFPHSTISVSALSLTNSFCSITGKNTRLDHNNTNGTVNIDAQCANPATKGDFLIASFDVTTLKTGNAAISFVNTSGAQTTSRSANILTSTLGGNFIIATPPPPVPTPTPKPAPAPAPKKTIKPAPVTPAPVAPAPSAPIPITETPTPVVESVKPVISNVSISAISNGSATLSWHTSTTATYTIRYGLSPSQLTNTVTFNSSQTDGRIVLSKLPAGKKIYYEITPSNNGVPGDAYRNSFQTAAPKPAYNLFLIGGAALVAIGLIFILFRFLKRRKQALSFDDSYDSPTENVASLSATDFSSFKPNEEVAVPPPLPVSASPPSPIPAPAVILSAPAASLIPPRAPNPVSEVQESTKTNEADDIPDMFAEGNRRLDEAEKLARSTPSAPVAPTVPPPLTTQLSTPQQPQETLPSMPAQPEMPPPTIQPAPAIDSPVNPAVSPETQPIENKYKSNSLWWKSKNAVQSETDSLGNKLIKAEEVPDMYAEGNLRLNEEEKQKLIPRY